MARYRLVFGLFDSRRGRAAAFFSVIRPKELMRATRWGHRRFQARGIAGDHRRELRDAVCPARSGFIYLSTLRYLGRRIRSSRASRAYAEIMDSPKHSTAVAILARLGSVVSAGRYIAVWRTRSVKLAMVRRWWYAFMQTWCCCDRSSGQLRFCICFRQCDGRHRARYPDLTRNIRQAGMPAGIIGGLYKPPRTLDSLLPEKLDGETSRQRGRTPFRSR